MTPRSTLDLPVIDPRLAAALTLPSAWYTDPGALPIEQERVFGRTWQLAAHAGRLASAGDYLATDVAGEPLLLLRDAEERLRAMSNVCRHRAGPVACGSGNRRSHTCRYHGWTYGLDGALLKTPEFDGVERFDPASGRLPPASAAAWGPLAFVNLDPAASSLDETMRAVAERAAGTPFDRMQPVRRRDYEIRCNWKVYVDNYLEGYHIPLVHPRLFRWLDYDAYRTDTFEGGSVQVAPLREGDDRALYFWVFPNLMLNVYPDNFSTNLILPLGHDRTLTIFEWYFLETATPGARAAIERTVAASHGIQLEDIAICEAVQRGLSSRTYDRGRFCPAREAGVHQFHRLLAACLGPDGAR